MTNPTTTPIDLTVDDARALYEALTDLLDDERVMRYVPDPMSTDPDDTVSVCGVCEDVDGHHDSCPVLLADRVLRVIQKRQVRS